MTQFITNALLLAALLPWASSDPVTPMARWLREKAQHAKVAVPDACWIASYGRGIGKMPACENGMEINAGLCYKKCQHNMKGVGPMCWPETLSYNRGAGVSPTSCSEDKPEFDSGLCYPACKEGYKGAGPVCWNLPESYERGVGRIPNQCPPDLELHHGQCYKPCREDFNGVGAVCWAKQSTYNRGVGKAPTQCEGSDAYHSGLCYPACDKGYTGVGPVCWQETCEDFLPFKCGPLCTKDAAKCNVLLENTKGKGLEIFNQRNDADEPSDDGFELFNMLSQYTTCTKVSKTLENHPAAKRPKAPAEEAKAEVKVAEVKVARVKATFFVPRPFQRD
jgi:hypothetical protein